VDPRSITLPEPILTWLEDPSVTELVLSRPGEAIVVRGRTAEAHPIALTGPVLRRLVAAVRQARGHDRQPWDERYDVRAVETVRGGGLRFRRRHDVEPTLLALTRTGKLLPEVRAFVEDVLRCRRSGIVAVPHARDAGQLFRALIAAWRDQAWVMDAAEARIELGIDAAVALGIDGFSCVDLVDLTPELLLQPRPVLVRVEAPDAHSAVIRTVAHVGLTTSLTLEQARCAVAAKLDFVVEEELGGRARGAWRLLGQEHMVDVDFVAGTRVRFGPAGSARTTPEKRTDDLDDAAPAAPAPRKLPRPASTRPLPAPVDRTPVAAPGAVDIDVASLVTPSMLARMRPQPAASDSVDGSVTPDLPPSAGEAPAASAPGSDADQPDRGP
jgi:hypothetical protein